MQRIIHRSVFTADWQHRAEINSRIAERATGRYDVELAAKFLGVTAQGFAGGRLSEYLGDEQLVRIDEIAIEVHAALEQVEQRACGRADDPFDFLLELKRSPFVAY